jgi:hypothetical protein
VKGAYSPAGEGRGRRPDRLRIQHRDVRTTSDRGVREWQPDGRGGRTTARRTGVHRNVPAIPPMYIGRRGRYDGIAEVDKSPLPQISVTSARGAPRARTGALDPLMKPLLTCTYIDDSGFGAPSDNSSRFSNAATADLCTMARPEARAAGLTPGNQENRQTLRTLSREDVRVRDPWIHRGEGAEPHLHCRAK